MKICRFNDNRLGLVEGETVLDVTQALDAIPALRWPAPMGDLLILHWDAVCARIAQIRAGAVRLPLAQVALLSPVANPSKIIGIARNRRGLSEEKIDIGTSAGARQDGDGLQMFIKASSALVGPSEGVTLRFAERRTDPEAELTLVIGRTGSDIPEASAMEHILGYCIGLDMTLRGKESQCSRKSIDSYAVLGPWIVTRDEIGDPDALDTGLAINHRQIQRANTRDLAFNIREIVAHVSRFYTLHPGDVIMVGTPVGFEQVHPGDLMTATFEGIGAMEVAVHG